MTDIKLLTQYSYKLQLGGEDQHFNLLPKYLTLARVQLLTELTLGFLKMGFIYREAMFTKALTPLCIGKVVTTGTD